MCTITTYTTVCMYIFLHAIAFNIVWADNADFCAKQYTGTGALKTDFTRCWFVSTYVTPYLFRMFDVCTFMLLDGGCMYHAYL